MREQRIALILLLILCCTTILVIINSVKCEKIFTTETQFAIAEYNSFISFATSGSYENASLVNNIWYFTDLLLANATSLFPSFSGIRLSVSAQNCNMSINRIDALNVFPPGSGWLEYKVSGVGNQTLNLNYSHQEWLAYTVYIDGELKVVNHGWSVSKDGWITVMGATSEVKIHYGRASATFTPSDIFKIPEYNSSINFAFNGSYVYTNFDNNIWRFQNLIVDDYGTSFAPTWYLSASARNCNVTITSYHAPFTSSGFKGWINYIVIGIGNQTFDNNYNKIESREINNYTVIIDGIVRKQNDGWTINDDGWITVTGATSNATILFEYIQDGESPPEPGPPLPDGIDSEETLLLFNVPLVTILALAAAIVAIVIVTVVAFKLVRRKALSGTGK